MRKAQYRVPGPGGDAEMIVFYFGPGQGGDAMANAERWAGQFAQPDGSSSVPAMKTSKSEVGGMQVLHVDVSGTYTNQMVSSEKFPDYRLLGAVVEGPDANWFFKLTGPSATVDAAKPGFDALITSIH
jgi:hypothetical protein